MGTTTTMHLKSAESGKTGILNSEERSMFSPQTGEKIPDIKGEVEIKEIRSREDLDLLYQSAAGLQNTIIILHELDLLNGVTDLRPAAIFAAPLSEVRLKRQVQLITGRIKKEQEGPKQKRTKQKRIIIYTHDGFEVIRTKEILHITAERAYCQIFLTEGRKLTVSKSMREIEDQLPHHFFRSHHSHVVNLRMVIAYKKDAGGELVLKDGSRVPVARSRKEDLEARLTN